MCVVVLTAIGGCKKSDTKSKLPLPKSDAITQVLQDFQMQDILNGSKNMVVQSIEGRISDRDRIADVDKPTVTFYKEGAVSSVLTAPQGRVGLDSHEVQVWGGVTVMTHDSATLTTDTLRYEPKKDRLITDDAVRLEKSDSITIGKGLQADPDLTRILIGQQKVYVKKR
jgi:LPS export ABC transporter protein LptC